MCKFVSAIVTEDKIYFPLGGLGGDHKHTSILFNHKIRDDIHSNHVEIEILPIGKSLLSTNPKDWKMVIDTDKCNIPKWFNKEKQEVTEIDAINKIIKMVNNFDGIFKYDLICYNCPNLTEINNKVNGNLDCSNCPNLTEINSKVNGYLNCSNCPNLTEINSEVGRNLDCSDCPKLTKISGKVNGYLNCYNCSKLTIQKKQKEN